MIFVYLVFFALSPLNKAIHVLDTGASRFFAGPENTVEDFATLATKNLGNLPREFTICSSMSTQAFKSNISPFLLLHKNGKPWIVFSIWSAEKDSTHHKINIQVSKSANLAPGSVLATVLHWSNYHYYHANFIANCHKNTKKFFLTK